MAGRLSAVFAAAVLAASICVPGDARADHDDDELASVTDGAVARTDDHYSIRLRSGKTIAHGRPKPRVDGRIVGLYAYDRIGDVFIFHWSDGDMLDEYSAVDAQSGAVTRFDRPPEFSPNGSRAIELVVGESLVSNQRPAVNIWKRKRGTFQRVWSAPLAGIKQCERLRWVSNGEARFDCQVSVESAAGRYKFHDFGTARLAVVRTAKGWRLELLKP